MNVPMAHEVSEHHFTVEPWRVRELGLDLDKLAQAESVFALSNGHIGIRGNLDEGDPNFLPGTYLNSFYEERPLPHAEAGYGFPEKGQTIVNVTDGKLIRLLVDDEPFDLRYGTLHHHERTLDLRAGTLTRDVMWESPTHRKVKVTSVRMVSFTQRAMMAVRYKVEAVDEPVRLVVQSEMVANEEIRQTSKDPRVAAVLSRPLKHEHHSFSDNRSLLMHYTEASDLRMAVACDHIIEGEGASAHTYVEEDWSRTTIGATLQPGESLEVTKFVAYGWSSKRSWASLRDQVDGSLSIALHTGWDELLREQREYIDEFWDGADVQIDGDPDVQQAVRFGLWSVLQAGARAEGRAIPAKGLTGPGYDGHAFWDTETFVLPVLSATHPDSAHDALMWRFNTLDIAREHAKELKLAGAAYPWRTIRGQECSGYWPAGMAAIHINADVALAAARQVHWTGDDRFDREVALPLLVESARLFESFGYHGDDGQFHISGVTGPDEYSSIVHDNTYTNLAAARNMAYAADACERHPDAADEMGVTDEEITAWRDASERMAMPFDAERGIHQQFAGSTDLELWDFNESLESDQYPLLLNYTYFDLYRKQVVKQADLVLAMHWWGDKFTLEEKTKAFDYYESITVRDSSLSACTQAVLAAEVGHLELAHRYLLEASLMDLRDLEHNTKDGVHIASLAGAWLALVAGFGGMRDFDGHLSFAPALPDQIKSMRFVVRWQGHKVRVAVTHDHVIYSVDGAKGDYIELTHEGETFTVHAGKEVRRDLTPRKALTSEPVQPVGKAPIQTAD